MCWYWMCLYDVKLFSDHDHPNPKPSKVIKVDKGILFLLSALPFFIKRNASSFDNAFFEIVGGSILLKANSLSGTN